VSHQRNSQSTGSGGTSKQIYFTRAESNKKNSLKEKSKVIYITGGKDLLILFFIKRRKIMVDFS